MVLPISRKIRGIGRINTPSSSKSTIKNRLLAIAKRNYFQGIAKNVTLICRDEMLHAKAGATVLRIVQRQWPETYKAMLPEINKVFNSVVEDEHTWALHAFSEGRGVTNLSAARIIDYVNYEAQPVAKVLGVPSLTNIKEVPLKYMERYMDSSLVQSAAQEIQITNYLVNSVSLVSEEEMSATLRELRHG